MSKRRSTKTSTPNIPQETLERARAQAGVTTSTPEPAPEPVATAPKQVRRVRLNAPTPEATKVTATTKAKNTPPKLTQAQLERSKEKGDLDAETIAYALAHPVKHISAQELAQAYGHVLVDLRNMGVLSVGLIVVLVVLAQFI